MYYLKFCLRYLTMLLIAAPVGAYASSWSCTHGDKTRNIVIEYASSGSVPCIVVYRKSSEGAEDQTLWSAENIEGYCEEKAAAFVAKQEGWGWACAKATEEKMESEKMGSEKMGSEKMESHESGSTETESTMGQ